MLNVRREIVEKIAKKLGKIFTLNGVSGLIANLYQESALNSKNLQNSANNRLGLTDDEYTAKVDNGIYKNFVGDKAGYGLAQWTSAGRKENLLNFAKNKKISIGDLDMQVDFLIWELQNKYKKVFDVLVNPGSTIEECARVVMCKFEAPANQSEANQLKRAKIAQEFYEEFLKEIFSDKIINEDNREEKNSEISGKISVNFDINSPINTNIELAEKAKMVANNYKTHYVLGCFGAPMTPKNKVRYTNNNEFNRSRAGQINSLSIDTFGFDCVCLIKALLGGWNADVSKTYGGTIVNKEGSGISYGIKRIPDLGADGMINKCKDISTDFSKVEVGEAVWLPGHIGIYIGNGLAVECTPKWKNKVQITACNCNKTGYDRRNWSKHGKLPYINYVGTENLVVENNTNINANSNVLKVGDKVKISSDAVVYGTMKRFSNWVYNSILYVRQINGEKIVVSTQKTGAITGSVDKKYIIKL